MSAGRRALIAGAVVLAVLATSATPVALGQSGDPTVAPTTALSADGRTASDGVRSLSISQVSGLEPGGQTISVAGSGYDASKGIYVALCVIPPRHHLPTSCGGGVDTSGQAGAAQWISSNPPSYAGGLAQPYGPGGSFSTTFTVSSQITPTVDCRQVRCAVVTRSDHTRTADRSQDIFVPVAFRSDPVPAPGASPNAPATVAPQAPPVVVAPPPTPPPDAPTTTTTPPAPSTTVASDGRSVSDGRRTLEASAVSELDPGGTDVVVTGRGFDPAVGIYVALCRVPDAGQRPDRCSGGSPESSAWIASDAPDYAAGLARPFTDEGGFEVTLTLQAVIDESTDCRQVSCGLVVRRDDRAAEDRSADLVLPVSFDDADPERSPAEQVDGSARAAAGQAATGPDAGGDEGSGSGQPVALAVGLVVLAAVGGGAVVLLRRRGAGAP